MKIGNILLDMDGIETDFNKRMLEIHNKPDPYLDPANWGNHNLDQIWGMNPNDFWRVAEEDFWASLDKTAECDTIVEMAIKKVGKENVEFLSSPSKNFYCEAGKKRWIAKHFPDFFNNRRYIFTTQKKRCVQPGALLIDDLDKNKTMFEAKGGNFFLFPRLWNSRYAENGQGLELLTQYLEGFK